MQMTYTCHNVEDHPQDARGLGHPIEFDVTLYPAEPATRTDPPHPATCEPAECPVCGQPVDVDELVEQLADEHEATIEDRAEDKRLQREGR